MHTTPEASNETSRVLVLQYAEGENLGAIEDALAGSGVEFSYVRAFEGQPIPGGVGESSGVADYGIAHH